MTTSVFQSGGPDTGETDRAALAVRARVLRAIGRPAGPARVRVWRVWENHYRVNVYAGAGPVPAATIGGLGSVAITHSFFVEADDDGAVLRSTPALPGPA